MASEAVAATRSRGHTSSKDLDTGIDLIMRSFYLISSCSDRTFMTFSERKIKDVLMVEKLKILCSF